jgi:hypothetical protein
MVNVASARPEDKPGDAFLASAPQWSSADAAALPRHATNDDANLGNHDSHATIGESNAPDEQSNTPDEEPNALDQESNARTSTGMLQPRSRMFQTRSRTLQPLLECCNRGGGCFRPGVERPNQCRNAAIEESDAPNEEADAANQSSKTSFRAFAATFRAALYRIQPAFAVIVNNKKGKYAV